MPDVNTAEEAVRNRYNGDVLTATIANGAALSDAIQLSGHQLAAIQMPAAWTAASIGFHVSHDGVTYVPLYKQDGSTLVAITLPTADKAFGLDDGIVDLAPWNYVKLWSQTGGAGVNQGAERIIKVVVK